MTESYASFSSTYKFSLCSIVYAVLRVRKPLIPYGLRQTKSAVEHAQSVRIHIILHLRKVSSGHLLSIETFYSIPWFCSLSTYALEDTFSHDTAQLMKWFYDIQCTGVQQVVSAYMSLKLYSKSLLCHKKFSLVTVSRYEWRQSTIRK